MPNELLSQPLFLLVVSVLVLASILVKLGMQRLRLPPVVGYLGLGVALRVLDDAHPFLNSSSQWTLEFLAQLGVASLLFHVGLRSNVKALLALLPRAMGVWTSDVVVSGAAGFFAARFLGFELLPALFVGTALSATSVGISMTVWEDAGATQSRIGELLLDVAELDDLSAIALLLLVLAVTPSLMGGAAVDFASVSGAMGSLVLKAAAFAAGCWLFAAFVEKHITGFFRRFRRAPAPLLALVGFGFGIAALAGWLGFSVAVGALFAGLMFSRDPEAVRLDGGFATIYELFVPFFFIDIGYGFDPTVLGSAASLGVVLFVVAVGGKFVGAGAPVAYREGLKGATILGISMAPRAEIALLTVRMGNQLGPKAIPNDLYGAVVLACAAASIVSPLALHALLARWPEAIGRLGLGPGAGSSAEMQAAPGETGPAER